MVDKNSSMGPTQCVLRFLLLKLAANAFSVSVFTPLSSDVLLFDSFCRRNRSSSKDIGAAICQRMGYLRMESKIDLSIGVFLGGRFVR